MPQISDPDAQRTDPPMTAFNRTTNYFKHANQSNPKNALSKSWVYIVRPPIRVFSFAPLRAKLQRRSKVYLLPMIIHNLELIGIRPSVRLTVCVIHALLYVDVR